MIRTETAETRANPFVPARLTEALPGSELSAAADAYARCREVTRERARNFYYGLRLTPEPRRSAIYSIYAWMRAADDAVDEAGTLVERRERLDEFAGWTRGVLERGHARSRVGRGDDREWLAMALGATIDRYEVDHAIFEDMLAGLRVDLEHPELATEDELARYCYGVAGTAGLACVSIWGLRPGANASRARELALRRGQAFQRTNILRDFAEDFDGPDRRVYLPREAFGRHDLDARRLRAWEDAERCEAMVREQAALARQHYAASAELESMIDPACAPTLWAMTQIYSGLLEQVEADPRRVVGERARLAPAAKATIAIRAAIGARMHRW